MPVPTRTPQEKNIWIAAGDGDLLRVQELVEQQSISPNAPDPFTYTPMHAAASYGQHQVLSYLVSKGGDVNVTDEDGDTPLYTVENVETAQWLISHGAITDRRNNEGVSPKAGGPFGGGFSRRRRVSEVTVDRTSGRAQRNPDFTTIPAPTRCSIRNPNLSVDAIGTRYHAAGRNRWQESRRRAQTGCQSGCSGGCLDRLRDVKPAKPAGTGFRLRILQARQDGRGRRQRWGLKY